MTERGDAVKCERTAWKRKILTVCVRLFLEQGYKETSITQITENAGVTRGSFQNLFRTKDAVLLELVETMFAASSARRKASPTSSCRRSMLMRRKRLSS